LKFLRVGLRLVLVKSISRQLPAGDFSMMLSDPVAQLDTRPNDREIGKNMFGRAGSNSRQVTMKIHVYVLRSEKDGKRYVGMTSNIGGRLEEHNKGVTKSTRDRRPFVLSYVEVFESRIEARAREKYFKTACRQAISR